MARWQPDAQGRLGQAAMELFGERGFDDVTVAEIADRAGLTPRTFYRHFGDKQEVLFAGSDTMTQVLTQAVLDAAPSGAPLDAVMAGLTAVCRLIGTEHEHSARRWAIISAHPELQERELIKLAGWAQSVAAALQDAGVDELGANLAAQTGLAVFRCAFDEWMTQTSEHGLDGRARAVVHAPADDGGRLTRPAMGSGAAAEAALQPVAGDAVPTELGVQVPERDGERQRRQQRVDQGRVDAGAVRHAMPA